MLHSPRKNGHRMLSSHFLHASHAHIVGNMLVLLAVGGKLEEYLGSTGLARLMAVLVPVVGVAHVTVTIVLNVAANMLGFGKPGSRFFDAGGWVSEFVIKQTSFSTISVGFSAVLFAMNALAASVLEPDNVKYCVSLTSLPPAIRNNVMRMLGISARDKIVRKEFCVPSRIWPLLQVLLTQLADPSKMSITGHLTGVVAAVSLRSIPLGLLTVIQHSFAMLLLTLSPL